jgi:hypothetical protein
MIVHTLEALFGFKVDTAQFNKASSAIDNFAENTNTAMAALAGHFAIQTIKDFVDSTTQAMADASRMAKMLGLSTQSLEELRYAAEKSGVSIDTLDDSMKELQIRAVDAKTGSGEAADAFKALGIRSTNAVGKIREPIELLGDVADRLKKLPTQSERIWVADAMFGDQGAEMLKIIEGGSEGLAHMRLEARELGYTLDESTSQSAIQFRQAITSLKAVLSAVVRTITKNILPAITNFVEGSASLWRSVATTFAMLSENTSVIRTVLIALGIVLAGLAIKAVIAFAPMFAAAAIIGLVALLIDDLWTAFSSGESVSKKVFDTIVSGLQSLKSWVVGLLGRIWDFLPANLQENLREAFMLIKSFLASLISILMTVFVRYFGFLFDSYSRIFTAIKNAIAETFDELVDDLIKAWAYVARAFVDHIAQAVDNIKDIILGVKNVIGYLVPDFVKDSFSAAVDYVGDIGSQYNQPSQRYLAPQVALPSNNHIQNNNNQSVNVSVNVKSGAAPQQIGSEVQKAVRKELEKERTNAFMGVNNYAY